RNGREGFAGVSAWLLLFAVMAIVVASAPGGVWHPKLLYLGYLPDRASLYCAVLLCCLLAAIRPLKWQVGLIGGISFAFFLLLFVDTLATQKLETKLEAAVAPLPPGTRVVATLVPFTIFWDARIHEQHIVDRACIGHCFFVGNYEPSSRQFRIKANSPNRVVA